MKKVTLTTVLMVCAILICFAAIAGLAGKWQGSIKLPDGNIYPVTYEFQVNGDQLTGTATAEGPPKTVAEGKTDGVNFSFSLTNDDGKPILHGGKYYAEGDSIALTVNYQGDILHGTLKRAKN